MSSAYVIGQITIKDVTAWDKYRNAVPATLLPWGGELVFRGKQVAVLAGEQPHSDVVVLRFPDQEAVNGWYLSATYQALIPLRQQAAEVILSSCDA